MSPVTDTLYYAAVLMETIGMFLLIVVFWRLHALTPSPATAIGKILAIATMISAGMFHFLANFHALPFAWTMDFFFTLMRNDWIWSVFSLLASALTTLSLLCLAWHFSTVGNRPDVERPQGH